MGCVSALGWACTRVWGVHGQCLCMTTETCLHQWELVLPFVIQLPSPVPWACVQGVLGPGLESTTLSSELSSTHQHPLPSLAPQLGSFRSSREMPLNGPSTSQTPRAGNLLDPVVFVNWMSQIQEKLVGLIQVKGLRSIWRPEASLSCGGVRGEGSEWVPGSLSALTSTGLCFPRGGSYSLSPVECLGHDKTRCSGPRGAERSREEEALGKCLRTPPDRRRDRERGSLRPGSPWGQGLSGCWPAGAPRLAAVLTPVSSRRGMPASAAEGLDLYAPRRRA